MKKIIAMILVLTTVLCLTACGSSDTDTQPTTKSSVSEDSTSISKKPTKSETTEPTETTEVTEPTETAEPTTEPTTEPTVEPTVEPTTEPTAEPTQPAPHTHTYTSSVTADATCTTAGVRTYTCSGCDSSYTETIAKLNHNYVDTVTNPTCTTDGYTTHTCTRCADSYKDTKTSATGHAWNKGTITKQATCKEDGVKTYTCGRCNTTKTETIDKLEHNYMETEVAATCSSLGYTNHICTRCADSYQDNAKVYANHALYIVDQNNQSMRLACNNCGISFTTNKNSFNIVLCTQATYWTEDGYLVVQFILFNGYNTAKTIDYSSLYLIDQNGQAVTTAVDPEAVTLDSWHHITYTWVFDKSEILNYGTDINTLRLAVQGKLS